MGALPVLFCFCFFWYNHCHNHHNNKPTLYFYLCSFFSFFLSQVYKLNAGTGTLVWKFQTLGKVSATPTLSADGANVFIGSLDTNIYSIVA